MAEEAPRRDSAEVGGRPWHEDDSRPTREMPPEAEARGCRAAAGRGTPTCWRNRRAGQPAAEPTTNTEADLRLKIAREKKINLQHDILAGKFAPTVKVRAMLSELTELYTTELEQSVQTLPALCEGLSAASITEIVDRFVAGVRGRLEAKMRAGVE